MATDRPPEMTLTMVAQPPEWDSVLKAFEASIEKGLDALQNRIEDTWHAKAAMTLKTSLEAYQKGIKVTRSSDGVSVTLEGWLPVAVETGVQRFDMKSGLLAGRSTRVIGFDKSSDKGFRTVSPQSTKWWHPGIQARAIYSQVKNEMDQLVGDVFEPLLSRVTI